MKIKNVFFVAILIVFACISGNVFAVLSGGGTQANPYLIQSRADFDEFSNPANAALYWANGKYTKLMCDIDLAGTTYTRAVIAPDTNIATAGFQGTQFNGVFDGNGHTISHLTITISTQDYIGLFGYVGLTGQVCDLSVENVNIVGREEVGCLIGNNEGSVFHCYSFGLVNGSEIVGGLVGSNSGSIISSYSTGSVSAAVYDAGGLVGWNCGTINSCYSSGQVIGSEGVGGLVSYNSASIINCYSTSLVNGTGSYMGGLVGYNNGGSVTISYSTGLVSGTGTYKGGLVGYNVIGDIASSFWDLDTSCQTISAGGEGKTTIEMQTLSTFTSAGWDFSDTDGDPADWQMPQNDYPKLAWQPVGRILWQAVKAPYPNGNMYYAIQPRITISDMKACSLKGPNMADFIPAQWVADRGQWTLSIVPLTLSQLQQKSLGTWQLKLIDNNDQESIYSFTISGTLLDSEFLLVPVMIEPNYGDSNVIAEHYTLRWDPNGAQAGADALGVEITGNGFSYFSNMLDLSTTSLDPGWLEIGSAYCKVGYADNRTDMINTPALVSGPAINWESTTASLVSGLYNSFTVKYSLDFNSDNRIDLDDLVVFCSHWLETTSDGWTWVKGSDMPGQPGNYGSKSVISTSNTPGARELGVSWIDNNGKLWLFGGITGNAGFNDLWKFNGVNWVWLGGSDIPDQPGIYGVIGVAEPANVPGARFDSVSWVDNQGNFWLFGGVGYAAAGTSGFLNDLWKYNPTEGLWTWIKGADQLNQPGVYGTKSLPAIGNTPGARHGSIAWTDSSGNLWLFGGADSNNLFNDLWKFDGTNWTWISGSNLPNQPAIYGTKGIADPGNVPGAREGGVSWIDGSGNLWLFGGCYEDSISYDEFYYNDLWKFDGTNWTWVSGSDLPNQAGIYGTQGISGPENMPGAREGSVAWIDSEGNLWLFGGYYNDEVTETEVQYNDLWKFDGTNWTWIDGSDVPGQPGVYGIKGIAGADNIPGAREGSFSWIDSADNVWLFGGQGVGAADSGYLNDLWKYGNDVHSAADFDDGGMVEFEDFAIFAQHWLEDVNNIADHVSKIKIETGIDYSNPDLSDDTSFEFDLEINTDQSVQKIEFLSPAGNLYGLAKNSLTEWEYSVDFPTVAGLDEFDHGVYIIYVYLYDGGFFETTVFFGVPETGALISQPSQVPAYTSISNGEVLPRSVALAWQACTEPDLYLIDVSVENSDTWEELLDVNLPGNSTELSEPIELSNGNYEIDLGFRVEYNFENDGVPVEFQKWCESDYEITVVNNVADINGDGDVDYDDLVIMANQWLQPPGIPSADIAPQPSGDGIVNLLDFSILADNWLKGN